MANSRPITIHNPACDDLVLQVQEVRQDLPPGEPHSLRGIHECAPGKTITVQLHAHGAVVITSKEPDRG